MSRFGFILALLALFFASASADLELNATVAPHVSLGAAGGRQWTRVTAAAQWSPRSGGVVEWYTGSTRGANNRVISGPMMLMYGVGVWDGSEIEDRTDVWYSTNKGRTWAPVLQSEAQFSPLLAAITVQDSQGRQFRIQGAEATPPNAGYSQDVYMSTNGGVSWTLQGQGIPSETGRFLGQAVVDSKDNIYVLMGQTNEGLLNDVWRSANQGRTWTAVRSNPSRTPPARAVHGSVASTFRDGTDVLYVMYGFSRYSGEQGIGNVYSNDVWATTSGGVSWYQLLAHAPFAARGDSQIEISSTGVIIIAGGVSSANSDDRRQLNDVWASLDGGYSWGQCTDNAEFSDRQFQYTVIDDEGYLYVMGGREELDGSRQTNDVWKSQYSYTDVAEVANRCGLIVPSCGVGLKCLPDDSGFVQGLWGVSCDACPYSASINAITPAAASNTMTILFVVFLILFLVALAALIYTYYSLRASGVTSPIPLPGGAQRWWNGNTSGATTGLDEGLNKGSTNSEESYSQLSIRDQM